MKTVVISNQKGGIGKTTTAVTLAYILARDGNKVVLIDADRQGNSTDTLNGKIEDTVTLYDALIGDVNVSIEETIQETQYENLDLIASDPLLNSADKELAESVDGLFRMKDLILKLEDQYDYAIVDTAPYINSLFHNCLIAADELIIPVMADRYSLQGLSSLLEQIGAVKQRVNNKLIVGGFLITNVQKNTILTRDVRETLTEIAESLQTYLFKSEIRSCNKVKECQVIRKPLTAYAPSCTAALDYEDFVDEMRERGLL